MQHRYTVGDVVYLASDLDRARPMTVVRRERERYAVVVWLDIFGVMNCKYLADAALVPAAPVQAVGFEARIAELEAILVDEGIKQ